MDNYRLDILTEDYAKEICSWRYDEEYSIYNFSDWEVVVKNGWDLAIKDKRENEYLAIILDNKLIGYGRITIANNITHIGIGLKPSYCGNGFGKKVMQLLIDECMNRYPKSKIALEVRCFNNRAINCYEKVGFCIKDKYIKNTLSGEAEFFYMELKSD